jgi:hypothetical protein
MERLEATAVGRQGDIEAELSDIEAGIDEIKKHVTAFEEQQNRTLVSDTTYSSILTQLTSRSEITTPSIHCYSLMEKKITQINLNM